MLHLYFIKWPRQLVWLFFDSIICVNSLQARKDAADREAIIASLNVDGCQP
jgi:hypothetical protein